MLPRRGDGAVRSLNGIVLSNWRNCGDWAAAHHSKSGDWRALWDFACLHMRPPSCLMKLRIDDHLLVGRPAAEREIGRNRPVDPGTDAELWQQVVGQ